MVTSNDIWGHIYAQRDRYFEVSLLNYLYYNITEGFSRHVNIEDIAFFFQQMYYCLTNFEKIYSEKACFRDYAFCPEGLDGLEKTKEKIEKLRENTRYKNMFHLVGDTLVIDEGFRFIPKKEWLSIGISPLVNLESLLYSKKEYVFPYLTMRIREEVDNKEDNQRMIRFFSKADPDCLIIEHICREVLLNSNTPRITAASEGVEVTEENLEYGKMLAARIISQYSFDQMKNQYLRMAENFAFLIQTCKPRSTIFDGTLDENSPTYKPSETEADRIFRRDYIHKKTCWIQDEKGIADFMPIQSTLIAKKDFLGNIWVTDAEIKKTHCQGININNLSQRDYYQYFAPKIIMDYINQIQEDDRRLKAYQLPPF